MCSFLLTTGGVNEYLIKLISFQQDYLGGDGAGIVYDVNGNYVTKKILPNEEDAICNTYTLLTDNIKLPIDYNLLALHTRKTTMGEVSIENTQPYLLKNKEGVIFTVLHKGTVYNHDIIAKSLGIPVGTIDSKTIANAIVLGKEKEFINDIVGEATIVWHRSDMPNTVFAVGHSSEVSYRAPIFVVKNNMEILVATSGVILNEIVKTFHTKEDKSCSSELLTSGVFYKITTDNIETLYTIPSKPKVLIINKHYGIPQSINRIIPKDLIYYFNSEPIQSKYTISLSKKVIEIDPIITTPKGFILEERLEDGIISYYKNDVLYGTEESVTINKLYFYKGILMKSREDCIFCIENRVVNPEVLCNYSFYPVPENIFVINSEKSVTNSMFYGKNVRNVLPLFSTELHTFDQLILTKTERLDINAAVELWEYDLNILSKNKILVLE